MSNVRDFGAAGDGKTDDTGAFEHALKDGDGYLEVPRGVYKITRSITVKLAEIGRFGLHGNGGTAQIIMAGPGPAFILLGTRDANADPKTFRPEEWARERMPTVSNIEVVGGHPEADGFRVVGVMQPTFTGVLIREVQTAIHVHKRARNILISHCHIYNNKKIGIHLDSLNLHQAIITGSHISYCRLGGIRIEKSEIRNLQITGNDIEYNNNRSHKVPGADAVPTAEIYIDASEGSIREGTISSNTIQATYSPGGANIRFIGNSPENNHKTGLWCITGNLIGSQDNNIHLTYARGISITGNVIYSGHSRNLLIEHCRNIALGSNIFDHNPDYDPKELCTGIRITDSVDCTFSGSIIQDCVGGKPDIKDAIPIQREGLVEIIRCKRINISGVQVLEGAANGIYLDDCSNTIITGCTVLDGRKEKLMDAGIRWKGPGAGNMISACRVGGGKGPAIAAEPHVTLSNNVVDG